MSKDSAQKLGYILVHNTDSLQKYCAISNSKIFIDGSFTLSTRIVISGNGVSLVSDKKSSITSKLWFDKYRFYESFTIAGSGVTIQGLILRGDNPDILTLDWKSNQTAIRVVGSNFHLINCDLINWGWASVYFYRFQGAIMEQCYCSGAKSSGYGYVGAWFEGANDQVGIVRDCIFENGREGIDAGGQLNYWSAIGNVTDEAIVSHKNEQNFGAKGTTITDNYFYGTNVEFPPPTNTGTLTIQNNFFTGDSSNSIILNGVNPQSKTVVNGNSFNGQGMNLATCSLTINSIKATVVNLSIISVFKTAEINFGDGSESSFVNAGILSHKYLCAGTYTISARIFDDRGIPSLRVLKKIVIGTGVGWGMKTTARFLPPTGFYQIQFLVDDTIKDVFDCAKQYSWKRIARDYKLIKGQRIALRLACIKDCKYSVQVWFDDFDASGSVSNATFEDSRTFSQKLAGINGSGVTATEKCGGNFCWHFEARPDAGTVIKKGAYSEIFVIIK